MQLHEYLQQCGLGSIVTEAVRSRDIEKAIKLISSYLLKQKIYTIPQIRDLSCDNQRKLGVAVWNEKNEAACFVWDLGRAASIERVLFTKNFDEMNVSWVNNENFLWDLEVQSKGANTLQMCKLVMSVLSGKVAMNIDAVNKEIKDAQLFESAEETSFAIIESGSDELDKLRARKQVLYRKIRNAKKRGNPPVDGLQAEYDELEKQIQELKVSFRTNVQTTLTANPDVDQMEDYFQEEMRATPEERFEDMEAYIQDVIRGVKPLALLCGAPGVGKTFRVKQALKRYGLQQDVDWKLLKGKSTPQALYTCMHDFKDEGQLVVMDDCDSVFKDDDSVNLLKAAYDSDDERYVTWNTARKIPMDEDTALNCDDADCDPSKTPPRWFYPKQFLYKGGGIIITNYRAGQIDTAVRNRALICDLDFTPTEIIDYIRKLSPKIMADVLTPQAKEQALDFLQDMVDKKLPVELSIRSFTLCAGIMQSDSPEASKQRRIREQMRLQAMRGGKKY